MTKQTQSTDDSLYYWSGYGFEVYDPNPRRWEFVGGVYIFCSRNNQDQWIPYYVGQTENMHSRIRRHEKWRPAQQEGATDIHVKAVPDKSLRERIEHELVQIYQPPMNVQLR